MNYYGRATAGFTQCFSLVPVEATAPILEGDAECISIL